MNLSYVILYVKNVAASLSLYEEAFSLKRKFLHEGGDYGELDTGSTTLAFAAIELGMSQFAEGIEVPSGTGRPHPSEIAFTTGDVTGSYSRAVAAGAVPFVEPAEKPWGQTVAYVRDLDGHLIEICSPVG